MDVRKAVVAIGIILGMAAPSSAALAAGGGGGGGGGAGADLQVAGSASTGSPGPTQSYWYTYQVKNSGPQTATSNLLTTALPPGETLNWAQLQNYAFVINCSTAVDGSGVTVITCPLPDMSSGQQYNVLIDVNAPPVSGTVTDTATVSSENVADPKLANNSATVSVQVKSATCTLPAGQPTLYGLVSAVGPNSLLLVVGGVTYTVS